MRALHRGCQACGREEIEWGCNGEGRIQGGIATVPGFGWWPIKAYRPCPSYLSTGGRYKRSGQSMDDIGFGGGGTEASSSGENARLRYRNLAGYISFFNYLPLCNFFFILTNKFNQTNLH